MASPIVALALLHSLTLWQLLLLVCRHFGVAADPFLARMSLDGRSMGLVAHRGTQECPLSSSPVHVHGQPRCKEVLLGLASVLGPFLHWGAPLPFRTIVIASLCSGNKVLVRRQVYNCIVTKTCDTFICFTLADLETYVLTIAPEITCWETDTHKTMVVLSFLSIVFYVIGIPLLVLAIMLYGEKNDKLRDPTWLQIAGFLYRRYGTLDNLVHVTSLSSDPSFLLLLLSFRAWISPVGVDLPNATAVILRLLGRLSVEPKSPSGIQTPTPIDCTTAPAGCGHNPPPCMCGIACLARG